MSRKAVNLGDEIELTKGLPCSRQRGDTQRKIAGDAALGIKKEAHE
jgi:hypothetical protein